MGLVWYGCTLVGIENMYPFDNVSRLQICPSKRDQTLTPNVLHTFSRRGPYGLCIQASTYNGIYNWKHRHQQAAPHQQKSQATWLSSKHQAPPRHHAAVLRRVRRREVTRDYRDKRKAYIAHTSCVVSKAVIADMLLLFTILYCILNK